MRSVLTLAFALAASTSSALFVPRHGATQPSGWLTDELEPYFTYHTRYLALGCQTKHETEFFEECCHPLQAKQSLSTRPPQCIPVSPAAHSSAAAVTTETPKSKSVEPPVPATTPAAKLAPPAPASSSATVNSGGFATYFFQNGVAGACGTVHQDTDLIAAIDEARYGNSGQRSALCGKKVKITNTQNKKTVTVTIADDCPTCNNGNSIDLSVSAFKSIATLDQGIVPITWSYI